MILCVAEMPELNSQIENDHCLIVMTTLTIQQSADTVGITCGSVQSISAESTPELES